MRWSKVFFCLYVLTIVSSSIDVAAKPLNVRVRSTAGGPQIFVDGRSVPPRFFWGRQRGGQVNVGKEWKKYSFEFVPESSVSRNGTLHFRFADTSGDVFLKDLSISIRPAR